MNIKNFKGKIFIMVGILCLSVFFKVYYLNAGMFIKNSTDLIEIQHSSLKLNYASSNINKKTSDHIKTLILYDGTDKISNKILYNYEEQFKFSKIKFNKIDLTKKPEKNLETTKIDLLPTNSTIILIISDTKIIPKNFSMENYIHNGGKIIISQLLDNIEKNELELFNKLDISIKNEKNSVTSIKFLSNVILNSKGKNFQNKLIQDQSNIVTLNEKSKIHIMSDKNTPIVWNTNYGLGSITFINSSMLQSKFNRGLINGVLSTINDFYIYPILNSKVVFIDDFPAPLLSGFDDKIKKRYNRNISEFMRDIWWPDVSLAGKKYNLKYSAYFIGSYNDKVEPEFKLDNISTQKLLSEYAIDLLRNNGELGLHGYNHQPLDISGNISKNLHYKPWLNQENAVSALNEALKAINTYFPKYKVKTYVPPSNIITKKGLDALKLSMENLLAVSSLFSTGEGEPEYLQEFQILENNIIEFPRYTSGYISNPTKDWITLNAISSTGILSHFVHADDMLDSERSEGLSWEEMKVDYYKFLESINRNFNWLEPLTTSEAAIRLKTYLSNDFTYNKNNKKIQCNTDYSTNQTFILKSKTPITPNKNCKISKIEENTYIIRTNSDNFSFNLN